MNKQIRNMGLGIAAVIALLWLGPGFIPSGTLKRIVSGSVKATWNIDLNIAGISFQILPNTRLDLQGIRFKAPSSILPALGPVQGSIETATVRFSLLSRLLFGDTSVSIALFRPNFQVKTPDEVFSQAIMASSRGASTRFSLESLTWIQGKATVSREGLSPLLLEIGQFRWVPSAVNQLQRIEALVTIPKTDLRDGGHFSVDLNVGANIQIDLPWTAKSALSVAKARITCRNLKLATKRYRIRQKQEPIFLDLSDSSFFASQTGRVRRAIVVLGDQTLTFKGVIRPTPFAFIGEMEPLSTSFETFPFRILEDTFPGVRGQIALQSPIRFTYEHPTRTIPRTVWKIQLDGIQIQNAEIPLPWFLLKEPQLSAFGQLHYFPKHNKQPPLFKLLTTRLETPNITIVGEGTYEPEKDAGNIFLQPLEIPLKAIRPILEANLEIEEAHGTLNIDTAFAIHFGQKDEQRHTHVMGRAQVSEFEGTWNNRFLIKNMSANLLFLEKEWQFDVRADEIKEHKTPTRSHPRELFHFETVKVIGKINNDGKWDITNGLLTLNEGQLKGEAIGIDPNAHVITAKNVHIFFRDITSLLYLFEKGWEETLQAELLIKGANIRLPLSEKKQLEPRWAFASGDLKVRFRNLSWMTLPIQWAFSTYMKSYLERFRVLQTLSKKPTKGEYEFPISPTFDQGDFEVSVSKTDIDIKKLELKGQDTLFTGSGKMTKESRLSNTSLSIQGQFRHMSPGFVYGQLGEVMLDYRRHLVLPFRIRGTVKKPRMEFVKEKTFPKFDQKAKTLLRR